MEPSKQLEVRWYSADNRFKRKWPRSSRTDALASRRSPRNWYSRKKLNVGATKSFWSVWPSRVDVYIGEAAHYSHSHWAYKLLAPTRVLELRKSGRSRAKSESWGRKWCVHRRRPGSDPSNRCKRRWRWWVRRRSGLSRRHGLWASENGILPSR